ncbi:hypothetical protein [Streptomyces ipomoeae]|uniref:hypothetical protein n=1 Tax=Streptomyces ipomoeae TaxID=103232 RepID=UPI0011468466|nr:hypothetical protein [Streptomyces ipomoeae]TQE33120.1 hypothetical protein Sipo7851_21730 [Streptomyces ipomoeae]
MIVRPRSAVAALTAGAVCAAAWWSRRTLRRALTDAELARITDRAAHQQTTARLHAALQETAAQQREALVLADAADVITRAQAREE